MKIKSDVSGVKKLQYILNKRRQSCRKPWSDIK